MVLGLEGLDTIDNRSFKVGVKLYSPDPPLESDVTVPESQPHGYPPWEEE